MSSMVLEMPALVAPTSSTPRREVIQKQLNTFYDERFTVVKQAYLIMDEVRVKTFLRQHNHLVSILEEGRSIIAILFGAETPVVLRLQRDPEAGRENLLVCIQNDLPTAEAVNRLLELSDLWLGERLNIIDDRLIFSV